MGRSKMTDNQKAAAAGVRAQIAEDKKTAQAALQDNSQFTNHKMWVDVDTEIRHAVVKAITKSEVAGKQAQIKELETKLAELRA